MLRKTFVYRHYLPITVLLTAMALLYLIKVAPFFTKTSDLVILKQQYSREAINYFYETAFHQDGNRDVESNVIKWNKNPTVSVNNSANNNQLLYTKKAIQVLNNLKTNIEYRLLNNSINADINVYFGDSVYLKSIFKETPFPGLCESYIENGIIKHVNIGILNKDNNNYENKEEEVVLEEIIQSVGIIGDSYTYPNSLFFDRFNPYKEFTKLDRSVVSLLYNPLIPLNYKRVDFEKDFSDMIYSVNSNEKILSLLTTVRPNEEVLKGIEVSFNEGMFYKHPKSIDVILSGEYTDLDSIQVQNTIACFNKVSKNINMKLKTNLNHIPTSGIFIKFKKLKGQTNLVTCSNTLTKGIFTMFPKRLRNDVNISYSDKDQASHIKQRCIVEAVYESLGPRNTSGGKKSAIFNQKNNVVVLKEDFQNTLKLIYDDYFIDGLLIEDFNKIKYNYQQQ